MFKYFLIVLLFSCANQQLENKNLKLTLLHTNDHHGHYLADEKGQYGMAARSTLLKKLRSELNAAGISHLLLSGGDINTGTMESDLFDAKPDFLGMKELGYDAMAVGNHEFDNSFEIIKEQKAWAGFPFLSANIFYKGTDQYVFEPLYLIKEINGVKIAIFGLTAGDTAAKASHEDAKKLFDFKNIIDSAKIVMKKLKTENPDIVIAVTHVGHRGSLTARGDIHLAREVDGIDVIIGGHSQEIINAEVVNDTIIVQAEDWGKYVGKLDLELKKGKLKQLGYKLIPVNLKKKVDGKDVLIENKIEEDPKFQTLFKPYKTKAEKLSSVTVGNLDKTLIGERFSVRKKQMPIGQFVGAAMMYKVPQIEVAVINGGALRDSLPEGKINRKKLHALHPYGNTISYVKMSAKELYDYIQSISVNIFNSQVQAVGGYPHFIGMKVTIDSNKIVKRIEAKNGAWFIERKENGNIISQKKEFIFGTMNFLARGGDEYPIILNKPSYVDTGFMINGAMMDFVESKKKIKASDYAQGIESILTLQ